MAEAILSLGSAVSEELERWEFEEKRHTSAQSTEGHGGQAQQHLGAQNNPGTPAI